MGGALWLPHHVKGNRLAVDAWLCAMWAGLPHRNHVFNHPKTGMRALMQPKETTMSSSPRFVDQHRRTSRRASQIRQYSRSSVSARQTQLPGTPRSAFHQAACAVHPQGARCICH
jgi:hypothetical protein